MGAPTKASYTISLSGECSGKITQQVVETVSISHGYETDDITGEILRATSNQSIYVGSASYGADNFYTSMSGNNFITGDKYSETITKGIKTVSFSLTDTTDSSYPRLWPITDEAQFASQITCKNGKTLSEVLGGDSLWRNWKDSSFKAKTTVKLVSSLSDPAQAQYTFKQSFSGIVEQDSLCTIKKGQVGLEGSSLICAQPKPIKMSVKVSAQGTAVAM